MIRLLLAAGAAIAAISSPAEAACSVARFRFGPGATSTTSMWVSSGASCGVFVYASHRSRFDSIRLVSPAANGTVSSRDGVVMLYRSRSGFKGRDSFAFAVTGRMRSGDGTATIRVNVTVE